MKRVLSVIVICLMVLCGKASADCVEICLVDTPCQKFQATSAIRIVEGSGSIKTRKKQVFVGTSTVPDVEFPTALVQEIRTCKDQ